jgi:hypothetical protein
MNTQAELDLAEEGYHAYGKTTLFLNYQGNPMPIFTDLPPKIQEAWCSFATRVKAGGTAQDGYQAYGDTTGWVNFQGKPMPTFDRLPMTIVEAWNAAAKQISMPDLEKALEGQDKQRSCPCLHTTPCDQRCTCINPFSSSGCLRCCSYGSPEQQRAAAQTIAFAIDSYRGKMG